MAKPRRKPQVKITVGEEAEYIVKYTGDSLQLLPDVMQKLVRCKNCRYGLRQKADYDLGTVRCRLLHKFKREDYFCGDGVAESQEKQAP